VHGNTKRLPKNTLKLRDVEWIVRFLLSYAEHKITGSLVV
jgi:hypothetical protein